MILEAIGGSGVERGPGVEKSCNMNARPSTEDWGTAPKAGIVSKVWWELQKKAKLEAALDFEDITVLGLKSRKR